MEPKRYRRVVAGTGAQGRSCVVSDGEVEGITLGTMSIAQLWTGALPAAADNTAPLESGTAPFRFEQMAEPVYAFSIADFAPRQGQEDAGMHATPTADHFHVLEGEVVLMLEAGEAVMRVGDSGVVRGVVHGWRNNRDEPAKVITFTIPA